MGKIVIGLTGPTGAGKSAVSAALAQAGCGVIDADLVARGVTAMPECLAKLKAEYGEDIVDLGGALNRKLLAARAFATPQKAAHLNEITHPIILKEILACIGRFSGVPAVVLDAPLLFESGAQRFCTKTVAVTAPQAVRLARIMQRDGISEEQARARMSAQQEDFYYTQRADFVLDGGTSLENLSESAKNLFKKIIAGESNET